MTNQANNIRIKAIKVEGLFGLYNHEIVLKEERVTVIHGPNGVGKTVLLKLTNSFLHGRYNQMLQVPFKTFQIVFDDESIARVCVENEPDLSPKGSLTYQASGQVANTVPLKYDSRSMREIAEKIEASSPFLHQVGSDAWLDRRSDEIFTAEEVVERMADFTSKEIKKIVGDEPKGLRQLRDQINVHFIEAQRLIRLAGPSAVGSSVLWSSHRGPGRATTATVQQYSQDLKEKLETILADYAKQSQKLDQSFPQRLLQHSSHQTQLTIDVLKKELQAIEDTRESLKKVGMLDRGEPNQDPHLLEVAQLDSLQPDQLSVMSVYAQDTKEKLSVLKPLADRVEVFLTVLNRIFTNKTVSISRESGLVICTKDEKHIPVTALSSGEQHELVLLYDLLFKVKPNTLVLIDEPELSLHISWQKAFMDDLLEIIRIAHFDVLVATHSPYIVGDRSELMVVLSSDVPG